jgi:hypothetical protein
MLDMIFNEEQLPNLEDRVAMLNADQFNKMKSI